jgi:KDO2-lipid IV(A) lauroyltransferase
MLLAAHQGNWEWMLTVVASVIERPFDALYRPLHNREMDNFFMAMRTRFGVNMVAADRAARAIPMLRKQVRALGIIGDQNPRRKDEKYWATFMGIETPVSPGPERIARMTDCPVFYVGMERLKRGKYRCVIDLLAEGPYTVEGELSQEYMSAVEAHIRKQPECWMWSHHRWRYAKSDCLV